MLTINGAFYPINGMFEIEAIIEELTQLHKMGIGRIEIEVTIARGEDYVVLSKDLKKISFMAKV